MIMESIKNHLQENLKLAYQKALDCDQLLDQAQAQGHGKFGAIFHAESGFKIQDKRFLPYVEELANEMQSLMESDKIDERALAAWLQRTKLFFETANQLQQSLKK